MLYIYSSVIQTNTELLPRHKSFIMEKLPINDIIDIASGTMEMFCYPLSEVYLSKSLPSNNN